MTDFEFLKKWQKMECGPNYDELVNLGEATACFTNSNPSRMANYALVKTPPSNKVLKNIENFYFNKNRISTIYFENKGQTVPNYEKQWEDSWMFFNKNEINKNNFDKVKIVDNENELEIFLDTFDKCYQKGDPQNPYGEVKDFIISSRKGWLEYKNTGRMNYFIGFEEDSPVATVALQNFEGLGYISSVGSLQKVRGKGFGKLVTMFAVDRSIRHGNTETALATEEGTYPNEFYKRIGFKTRFTAVGFYKKV